MVPLVLPENLDRLVPMVKLVQLALKARKERQVTLVPLEKLVLKEEQGTLEKLELKVLLEALGPLVQPEKVHPVTLVPQVILAPTDQLVLQVVKAQPVRLAALVKLAHKE